MAIVVTALGTYQYKTKTENQTLFSSVSVSTGDCLFLCFVFDKLTANVWDSLQFNTVNTSGSVYSMSGETPTVLAFWQNLAAATGDVVINWVSVDIPAAVAATLYKASGLQKTLILDKSATGAGTSTIASAGPTATLSQADELVIAVTGVEDEVDDAHGTWTTGANYVSGNEQFAATNGSGDTSNVQCHSVAEVVSATAAQTGTDGTHDSSNWDAVIATFKGAYSDVASLRATRRARSSILRR